MLSGMIFEKQNDFLVCVDSDGCVFDTMEIKHKECFCPAAIEHFGLQPVSKYARDAWDYVNLYSPYRGVHRLLALLKVMDLLATRREVQQRQFVPPLLPNLRVYCENGGKLSNDGLQEYLNAHPEADDVRTALEWSQDVNERIARMVHHVPPFPFARERLESLRRKADLVVVSATQTLALEREWAEHSLLDLAECVYGQEGGSKTQILAALKGLYTPGHILMIGDAPGDCRAAHENGALFYPIRPEEEAESWDELNACAEAFFQGRYAGGMENANIERFNHTLPDLPRWEQPKGAAV